MTAYYDLKLPHEIYYDCPEVVPLRDVIRSLQGLEKSLNGLPYSLTTLLGVNVQGVSIKLESVETGSELIRFWSRLRFRTDEERDEFIYRFGQEHPKIVRLIDVAVLSIILVSGYKMLFNADKPSINIEANNSVVLFAGSNLTGLSEEHFAQAIEKTIEKHPELKQASLDLIAPAKNIPGTAIRFGANERPLTLTSAAIDEMPTKVIKENSVDEIDYKNVLLDIRATDLDYRSKGWSAHAGGLERRLPATLYPHIDPNSLTGTVYADIGVLYKQDPEDDSRLIPTNLIIKRLNLKDIDSPVQAVRPYVENKEYEPASNISDHSPQATLF